MVVGICKSCSKNKEVARDGKSQGLCHECYKKLIWKPRNVLCKRCNRELPMHAKGFCAGCYNSVFHIENVKEHNARRRHGIEPDLYNQITKRCVSCGFDKIVDLHHLDHNHSNRSESNLVGLCPNCHKMIHSKKYQHEIFTSLKEKGYNTPQGNRFDNFFKK